MFLLIPLALVLVVVVIWAFFWAIRSDQFEDLEGPAHAILMDDDREPRPPGTGVRRDNAPTAGEDGGESG